MAPSSTQTALWAHCANPCVKALFSATTAGSGTGPLEARSVQHHWNLLVGGTVRGESSRSQSVLFSQQVGSLEAS